MRGRGIQGSVESEHTAEGRNGIAAVGVFIRRFRRVARCHPAGVSVFDDDAGTLVQRVNALHGSVGVHEVVEGQRFTLQLLCLGD